MYQGLARSQSKFLIYSPKKVVKLERHVKAIHKSPSNFDFPSDSFKNNVKTFTRCSSNSTKGLLLLSIHRGYNTHRVVDGI